MRPTPLSLERMHYCLVCRASSRCMLKTDRKPAHRAMRLGILGT